MHEARSVCGVQSEFGHSWRSRHESKAQSLSTAPHASCRLQLAVFGVLAVVAQIQLGSEPRMCQGQRWFIRMVRLRSGLRCGYADELIS